MKKSLLMCSVLIVGLFFIFNMQAIAQDQLSVVEGLPGDVNKVVLASCSSCHSNQGGIMAKSKLNFSVWANYSPEKQREKAIKMYSELDEGKMPPKAARAKHPELIPTKEQIEIIRKWSETFADVKK
jgi:mono/diheme cytochrome c family protein